ncbi:toll-like receptor 6 [Clupea harengus]|uniref:Toll-like receptor 6 n=1 Tax=Clupea harengus TaxID=7950 RepID=A0A6P3WEJ7_CLUHA|nr:toll-like receptor 6 [Clupea harengus]
MSREAHKMYLTFWIIAVPSIGILLHGTMAFNTAEKGFQMCMTLRENTKDLRHHNLNAIPPNLPAQTEYLDISYNNIARIEDGQLINLTQLCFLKATNCNLRFISPDAFANNKEIKVLNVSNNLLKIISNMNLNTLRVIDLSGNEYYGYALPDHFSNFTHLEILALGSKNTISLKLKDFTPLKDIHLEQLILGEGIQVQEYEPGSLAQLRYLKRITLNVSFCQSFVIFDQILVDLNQTQTQELSLVKFVPDDCHVLVDPFTALKNFDGLRKITIIQTWINSTVMVKLLKNVWHSPIEDLTFINIVYNEDTPDGMQFPNQNTTTKLKSITFDGIKHYQYRYPKFNISVEHFTHLSYLKFSGTGMNILPCNLISAIPSLQILDLSDNLLEESGFWWPLCKPTEIFPSLRHLSLSHNRFFDLALISKQSSQIKLLESLDLSFNSIRLTGPCSWSPHLTELSLSHNNLGNGVFKYLSTNFKRLDLSKTGITTISQKVLSQFPSLTHLILSSNNIQVIPLNLRAPVLQALFIDQNAIAYISEGVLDGLPKLETLVAGKNPFSCTCDSYWFVTAMNKSLLPDWPLDYSCSTPPSYADTSLVNFKPGNLSCHPWLQAVVSFSVLTVIIAVFAIVFHVCDGVWYTKMLWVWIRVKRRARKGEDRLLKGSFNYHAFISYSQHDSAWVDTQLVPTLEGTGLSLCIHERDFVPGQWIVDNIINCVEASYKTIFVLSQNFVQSEWCNYELFFAQHRAISVDQDSVVFILLEPIPPDSLPSKFLKLRTLLRQQTYLEWPKDECKKHIFWSSLRSMLQIGDKGIALRNVATNIMDTCSLLANEG